MLFPIHGDYSIVGILIVQTTTTWDSIGLYVSLVHLHHSSATSLNNGEKANSKIDEKVKTTERKLVAESNIIRLARQKRRREDFL